MSYRKGFEDGLRCFAWSKGGLWHVGRYGTRLDTTLSMVKLLPNFNPPPDPPAPESCPLDDLVQLVKDAARDELEQDEWTANQIAEHFLKNLQEVLEGRGLVMGEVESE